MNHQPSIFDRIIFGDLRPWLETNSYEEKFKSEIGDIKVVEPQFQPLYEIEFVPRFNYKTRYYHKLITSEANNYCNSQFELISPRDDTREIKYLLREFRNKVKTQLNEVAKIIKANNYDLKYLSDLNTDKEHEADTFVIQLLKTALIKVYLEVQERFKTYISVDDYMEINDLQALSDSHNEPTFLKRQTILEIPIDVKIDKPKIKNDAASKNKSFIYKKLAKESDALNDLWDALTHNKLINEATSKTDLKKIFSGKVDYKPVIWTGNISDLYYFIVLIHNKYKCVDNIFPYHWQVACKCFIKSEEKTFDPGNLKSQKIPKKNAAMIEKVASVLIRR